MGGMAFGNDGASNSYALLHGSKGTVMKIVFQAGSDNHGFGEAVTNKGDKYKVMF